MAVAHKLACLLPDKISAIVAISGGHQFNSQGHCKSSIPVPILQIHGTEDCIWPYNGELASCSNNKKQKGSLVSVQQTMKDWVKTNSCQDQQPSVEIINNLEDDTEVEINRWNQCQKPVSLYKVNNGGHFWPSGYKPRADKVGSLSAEIGNYEIWEFLSSGQSFESQPNNNK